MTARVQPESKSPSRRALLAGALGGLGAWAATAIGRSSPVRAGVDGDVVLNTGNSATSLTTITAAGDAFRANSTGAGYGVFGTSNIYIGVLGRSEQYIGTYGYSASDIGVYGASDATDHAATVGRSIGNSTGVQGYSGVSLPAAKAKTGVFGSAGQDASSKGVWGKSAAGHGLHGESNSGWAGYFDGRVLVSKYAELVEIGTPSAPGSNHARLFVRDNGSGKIQLCVRFHTGAVKVLATQP